MSVLLKLTFRWVAAKLMPALSHEKRFVAGYKDSGALYDTLAGSAGYARRACARNSRRVPGVRFYDPSLSMPRFFYEK